MQMLQGTHWEWLNSVQAYIEGPYGAPMIDTHSTRFASFLIISSGLGWTLLRACKRQLLSDISRGRDVKSVQTVISMKGHDLHLFDEFGGWDTQWDADERNGSHSNELVLRVRPSWPSLSCFNAAQPITFQVTWF